MAKVKPWVKIAGIAIIAGGLGLGLNAAGVFKGSEKSSTNGNGGEKKEQSGGLFGSKSKKIDYITVGTNTYAGFLPFMYLNNGLEPNEDCILYKEYGLKMKVVIQDDFQAGRMAFKNGNIDVIYCTVDAIPVEMGEGSEMTDARVFNPAEQTQLSYQRISRRSLTLSARLWHALKEPPVIHYFSIPLKPLVSAMIELILNPLSSQTRSMSRW